MAAIVPQNTVTPVTPNVVLIPSIVITTRIVGGALVTSANLALQPGYVDGSGVYSAAGDVKHYNIPDVNSLPTEISSLSADFSSLQADILKAVSDINAALKLV